MQPIKCITPSGAPAPFKAWYVPGAFPLVKFDGDVWATSKPGLVCVQLGDCEPNQFELQWRDYPRTLVCACVGYGAESNFSFFIDKGHLYMRRRQQPLARTRGTEVLGTMHEVAWSEWVVPTNADEHFHVRIVDGAVVARPIYNGFKLDGNTPFVTGAGRFAAYADGNTMFLRREHTSFRHVLPAPVSEISYHSGVSGYFVRLANGQWFLLHGPHALQLSDIHARELSTAKYQAASHFYPNERMRL